MIQFDDIPANADVAGLIAERDAAIRDRDHARDVAAHYASLVDHATPSFQRGGTDIDDAIRIRGVAVVDAARPLRVHPHTACTCGRIAGTHYPIDHERSPT
jgi:hypothetical protein